jgi:hypothetical protein
MNLPSITGWNPSTISRILDNLEGRSEDKLGSHYFHSGGV